MSKFSLSTLAVKMLGYSYPCYVSSIASAHPQRPLTEKNARRFEQTLGLEPGWFDADHDAPAAPVAAPEPAIDEATIHLISDAIRLVGAACADEAVTIPL